MQDYLCNRLCTLPEVAVEKYLSQLCQLVVTRPRTALEGVIVHLCSSSLRIAVKVCSPTCRLPSSNQLTCALLISCLCGMANSMGTDLAVLAV